MNFNYNRIKDPGYFAENRVPAHSDHVCYASTEELAAGESSLRMSLNGPWKFHYALNITQAPEGFEQPDFDCGGWADIPVPAHVQMEGYGVPQYCNTQYPWDGYEALEPGEIPKDFNPVMSYIKSFYLPDSFAGKRVFVSLQGAESCAAVWLNGHYVGFTSDSFTPHDFELTPYLVDGENRLACRLVRFSAGSWAEDQDFMRFSGLYREVFLYAAGEGHIFDVRVRTLLDDAYTDAVLDVAAQIEGESPVALALELTDAQGKTVASRIVEDALGETHAEIPVSAPRLWSSEDPYLYTLTLVTRGADGSVLEAAPVRVGFRRFEIRDGLMRVNGVRVVFKGVNRHDYCAETGRAVPDWKYRRDLLTMKRLNINAVRTSHYPNASLLYQLCDELGLYVIDENNMETHGIWERVSRGEKPLSYALPGDREDWKPIMLDRVNSTYQRDKNHPCVVMWSCGNESLGGDVIYEMSALFRRLDPTRPVHYEGVDHDGRRPETSDVYSQMYTPVKKLRAFIAQHRDKPMILCEYTHSMGNSNGAMHWYTEYAYEEPLYQGGFIWDYLDQSVRGKDRYGQTAFHYGGDNGEMPHDGNFCGNGILYGDGEPSEKCQEVKYNYQNIAAEVSEDELLIKNRCMFTNTDAFDCVLLLQRDGETVAQRTLETHVPPLSEERFPNPFAGQTRGGEYAVTVSFRLKEDKPWARRGDEVAFGQGVWRVAAKSRATRHAPLRVVMGTNNIGVHGDHFTALFGKLAGGLIDYKYGGVDMIRTTPMPNFWRAPIDNDRGNLMPQRYAQWKLASMYATNRSDFAGGFPNFDVPVTTNDDGSVTLRYVYTLPTSPVARCAMTYTVHPCGRVNVALEHDPVEGLSEMPEFGVMFTLSADFDQLRYYGLGPDENTIDRHEGARLGVWQRPVRDMMTRYLIPQECGGRTGVRWAEVTDFKGRGLRFIGDDMTFSALPWSPHEIENARHSYELPPIHNTVVRCIMQQVGVAGDDSWGALPHDEYLIDVSKPMRFEFSFEGKL